MDPVDVALSVIAQHTGAATAREQFLKVAATQTEIFTDIVLGSPPNAQLDLVRLLEERNGLLLAAAREFRTFLGRNPKAHESDPAELTCEDP